MGVVVVALLTGSIAAAAMPGVVEQNPKGSERVRAGSITIPARPTPVAPVDDPPTSSATVAPAPVPPRPTSTAPHRAPTAAPVTQPPPAPGRVHVPPPPVPPGPSPCLSLPPNPAWQATEKGLFLVPVNGSPVGPPIVPESMKPQAVAFSPDGGTLAFEAWVGEQSGNGDNTHLFLVNRDGTGMRRIAEDAYSPRDVVWSPDGRWLAFHDYDPVALTTDIYVTDAEGRQRRQVTTGGMGGSLLQWSPQSDRLAFTGNRRTGGAWVVQIADGQLTKLLDMSTVSVSWSPDGTRLSIRLEPVGAVVVAATGSSPLMLAAEARSALWSPTADEIALEWRGVTVSRPDGTVVRNLGGAVVPHQWSPDGRWMAASGNDGLFLMSATVDRCPQRVVAKGSIITALKAWSPDSTAVAVLGL